MQPKTVSFYFRRETQRNRLILGDPLRWFWSTLMLPHSSLHLLSIQRPHAPSFLNNKCIALKSFQWAGNQMFFREYSHSSAISIHDSCCGRLRKEDEKEAHFQKYMVLQCSGVALYVPLQRVTSIRALLRHDLVNLSSFSWISIKPCSCFCPFVSGALLGYCGNLVAEERANSSRNRCLCA